MCSGGCGPYRKKGRSGGRSMIAPKGLDAVPLLVVDFVSGRGWNTSCQLLDEQERQELAAEIEWAYIRAPLEDIVMLETKPQELCSWQDLVAGTRFIVEHMLFAWLQEQNVEQGLAPSRSQLVERALANIPLLAPEDVKAYLNTILASSDRSQRRWLAKGLGWACWSLAALCLWRRSRARFGRKS